MPVSLPRQAQTKIKQTEPISFAPLPSDSSHSPRFVFSLANFILPCAKVDKMEAMIGSYPPKPEPYTKVFAAEECPSGMLARSGNFVARSRIIDDDGHVWLDFEWSFKIGKEW